MTSTSHQLLSFIALVGGMLLTLQGSPGMASESGCRVAPLHAPEGAAFTGESYTFEREVDGDGVADVVRLEKSIGSGSSLIWGTQAPTDEDREKNVMLVNKGFEVLAMTPRHRILGTRHGVVAIDIVTERYAWFYVFPGGHQLRWKSIFGATIEGEDISITVLTHQPSSEQIGAIMINLYDGEYSETWAPLTAENETPELQRE